MHSQSMSKSILDWCIWAPQDLIDALPFLMRAWSCLVFALTIGATGKGNFSHQIIKQSPSRFDLLRLFCAARLVFSKSTIKHRLDCVTVPYFPWDRRCRSLSSTGRHLGPSGRTGESTKCQWVGVVEGTAGGKLLTQSPLPKHREGC